MEPKVLVVDDVVMIQTMLQKGLQRQNLNTFLASSGEEAIDIARRNRFDLFFLDIKLPEMDGIELCKILKNDNPLSVFFAITSYSSVFDLVACREAGFDDYFLKPFDLNAIVLAAEQALERVQRWRKGGNSI